jgi:hypothetical protein
MGSLLSPPKAPKEYQFPQNIPKNFREKPIRFPSDVRKVAVGLYKANGMPTKLPIRFESKATRPDY